MSKIFETNSSFHVKKGTTVKVQFFSSIENIWEED